MSSGGGFTVQPTDLGTNGSQYSAVADQVRQIHQTLVDKLNAEGACWGNDEAGAQFAKTYVPPAMTALGTPIYVQIRAQKSKAQVVRTPFYKRMKKAAAPEAAANV